MIDKPSILSGVETRDQWHRQFTEVWTKQPETRLHDKDTNKKWTASGRMGFEFLNVVHIVP
jgi:hypothetical protein